MKKLTLEQEHHIQRRIVDLLEACGAEVVENRSQKWDALASAIGARNAGAKRRAKGQCDLIVAAPGGVTLWLEIKRAGGKTSPEQEAHHARLRELGHVVVVTRDITEVADAVAQVAVGDGLLRFLERLRGTR